VLGVIGHDGAPVDVHGIRDTYEDVLGPDACFWSLDLPGARATVFVASSRSVPEPLPGDLLVWGSPVGSCGIATEEELDGALSRPERARDLLGVYVLVALEGLHVRMLTSAALPHTLTIARGPSGTAVTTKALASCIASGREPRIWNPGVTEQILFGYVLGSEELIDGTDVLDEATVVDVDADGVHQSSFWPIDERFAPTPPTTVDGFIETLSDAAVRYASVPGANLGLTAGRDSTLLAASLRSRGLSICTFTFSDDLFGLADLQAATETGKVLGVPHSHVRVSLDPPIDAGGELVRTAVWHEGMQRAADYVCMGLDWEASDLHWLTGHGGEIGRAFYGVTSGATDPASHLMARFGGALRREAYAVLKERLQDQFAQLRTLGRPREDDLDVFYARHRMRKWLPRLQVLPQFKGLITGFLDPAVVSGLLGIPVGRRASASFFDEALARLGPDLAKPAAPPLPPRRRPIASGIGRARRRLRATLPTVRATITHPTHGMAYDALGNLTNDGSTVRERQGDQWWEALVAQDQATGGVSERLWYVLSIEALAARLERARQRSLAPASS
jgi:hypothetical protein